MRERKIGEIFKFKSNKLKVIEEIDKCLGCKFKDMEGCRLTGFDRQLIGSCATRKEAVIFAATK